jgi:hypothetical protein
LKQGEEWISKFCR